MQEHSRITVAGYGVNFLTDVLETTKFQLKATLNRTNKWVLLVFMLISVYLLMTSIAGYEEFQTEKSDFLLYEKQKVSKYQNYEQYGAYGFSLLFEPTVLSVYFNNPNLSILSANIDTKEILNVTSLYTLKDALNMHEMSVFKFALIFGSLIALLYGINSLKGGFVSLLSKKYIMLNIAIKIIVFTAMGGLFFFLLLIVPILMGHKLGLEHIKLYSFYAIYQIFVFLIFVSAGMVVSLKTKNKKRKYVYAALIFVIGITIFPAIKRSNSKLPGKSRDDKQKLTNLMEFERQASESYKNITNREEINLRQKEFADTFMQTVYKQNLIIEDQRLKKFAAVSKNIELRCFLLPTAYIGIISDELSSKGPNGYINFNNYIHKMRKMFLDFYIERRFSGNMRVEDFIKTDENVYKSDATLPKMWRYSLYGVCLYLFVLFAILIRMVGKATKDGPEKEEVVEITDFIGGNEYFYGYNTQKQRERVLSALCKSGGKILCQRSIENTIEGNTPIKHFISYICYVFNFDKNMVLLEMKNIEGNIGSNNYLNYFCLVAAMLLPGSFVVLDNFLKGVDKDFERVVLQKIKEEKFKPVIYLSSEMFVHKNIKKRITGNAFIEINVDSVSFR